MNKSARHLFDSPQIIYHFMAQHAHAYPIARMAALLGVSRSGYYRWRHRPPAPRTVENQRLRQAIRRCWEASQQRYGAPKIHAALVADGWRVSRPRVARHMRQLGIASRLRKQWVVTPRASHALPVAPHLLARDFQPTELGAVWISDITYLRTAEGWAYLTTVMDLADRQIIGWALTQRLTAQQTSLPAWRMARQRRPLQRPILFHSDRGVQYACQEFTHGLAQARIVTQSMSRKGNCWDNAPAESWFKTLKAELTVDTTQLTYQQTRQAVFQCIEIWYNRQRLHATLGYRTPANMEQLLRQKQLN
mgnify:CR=1 FL=1